MTGMKEGAGEDPFADDAPKSDADTTGDRSEDADGSAPLDDDDTGGNPSADSSGRERVRIPYKFRRDGVQDGRDRVPLFLHPETKRTERDALHELEERFDGDVSLTDLREAVMKVGLTHLDEVEGSLEEWGYGMRFE
jgi:hypothetical protein